MTLVIAHRGASGEAPENTLAAFRRAVQLNVDLVELDVRFSRDRRVIVIHDETVQRTTTGHGAVAEMTLNDLRQLDCGSWFDQRFKGERIPTLEEVIAVVRPTPVQLLIEIKDRPAPPEGFETLILETLGRNGMQSRAILQSFDLRAVKELKQIEPSVAAAALLDRRSSDPVGEALEAGAETLAIKWKLLRPEIVEEAHRRGVQVYVWTVNKPKDIGRMRDFGVDGIISNYPQRIRLEA
ncbi:MAG: glycerophosphodiester phosphodiesterase [Acidobacteriota bacterium]